MSIRRISLLALAGVAFLGGIVFASSMDWTGKVFAQGGTSASGAPAPQPPRASDIRTVADVSNAFVSISEAVTPSVVSISAERTARARSGRQPQVPQGWEDLFRQFEGQPQPQQPQSASGTGFIVSRDGYILTNNHVVEGADRIRVAMQDRRVFDARLIGRDPDTDVAVLKIEGRNYTPVTFGNDESLRIGEWVLAIGNPLGLDFTVTAGIVSAKGRGLAGLNERNTAISDFIQTDAAINPGNSGGPLVNARGEVVGVNSAIASRTGYYSGYGFAIPISLAKIVMDDLIAHGEVRRAVLGVQITEVSPEDAEVAGLRTIAGVKVSGFPEGESPARRAGLDVGDVITKVDGQSVDRVSALQRAVRAKNPGENVELEAWRYGQRKTFTVRLQLAERAATVADNTEAKKATPDEPPATTTRLGISVAPIPEQLIRQANIPEQYRGLRVASVDQDGPAGDGKLAQNDIIAEVLFPAPRARITSNDDLNAALRRVRAGEVISLLVYRPAAQGTVVVNVRTK